MKILFPSSSIINFERKPEIKFGLSYAKSMVDYDIFSIPKDWKDATLEELLKWIPEELRGFPKWSINAMFPFFVYSSGKKTLSKTTVFLTNMSGSNQTWTVLEDWNSNENIVHTIGAGGSGGGSTTSFEVPLGGGGGGGAYSATTNISLTPGGSATFRLGNLATAGTSAGGTGSDTWFNGSTLAGSSVGAKGGSGGGGGSNSPPGGSGGSGGSSSSGKGDTKYNGGNGSAPSGFFPPYTTGGGGGAAGPYGAGNNASNGNGGSGGSGSGGAGANVPSASNGAAGSDGTEFQSDPNFGSGGGGSGIDFMDYQGNGGAGGNYGAGGGGAMAAFSSRNGGQGAQGLIVIINNHINGK